ncbi:MAG: hypothetical protein U5K81_12855 [Trueperaceae bacterium]|nr:hypothetical protein [Trueperaceae bacterium]
MSRPVLAVGSIALALFLVAIVALAIQKPDVGNALVAAGTLGLASVALAQVFSDARARELDRRLALSWKDVDLTSDGSLRLRMVANLGNYPVVVRYFAIVNRQGERIAHKFGPVLALPPGRADGHQVSLAATNPRLLEDMYDRVPAQVLEKERWLDEAYKVHLVIQHGGRPGADIHACMPVGRVIKQGLQVAFSHVRVDYDVRPPRAPQSVDEDEAIGAG